MDTHAQKLQNAPPVGKGFRSDVYAWGQGRVLKLLHGLHSAGQAQREYAATRAVHAAGFPVPATFEVIEIAGRSGIVFERVDGVSLLEYTQAKPWSLFGAIRLMADLHARIHRCKPPTELPSLRQRLTARIEAASDLTETDRQNAKQRLAELPDGMALCHGDFHPGNVLITLAGPVVIDWSSASYGDPFGDVAWTSRLMRTARLPPWSPGYMHLILRCLRSVMHRSYLKRYLQQHAGTRRQIEAWELPVAAAARSWRVSAVRARIGGRLHSFSKGP
jgi:aminoglycoside phosphotransferase (APT) family kinase protein